MRKRFEQQLSFGIIPIGEVEINQITRHQLAYVLSGLQYAFNDEQMSEELFILLEKRILGGKKRTGRMGMSLWEILVNGVVKLSLDIDFDFLHDMANNHREFRGILGVSTTNFSKGKQYHHQTLKENVQLLDDQAIIEISSIIVKGGHKLIRDRDDLEVLDLSVKSDSFVVESHIHFPTDMNLLWDSCRKCLDIIGHLRKEGLKLVGWGQYNRWYKKIRAPYRKTSEIHRLKGANYKERLEGAAKDYLSVTEELSKRMHLSLIEGSIYIKQGVISTKKEVELLQDLAYYLSMVDLHRDLLNRRVILGEKIPHSEKVFSIFESHAEWNTKGKLYKGVELGHNVLIATDQYQFILYHEVYEKQVDKTRTIAIGKAIADAFPKPNHSLGSISFDRNFYSYLAKQALNKLYDVVVLPKPGKKTKQQKQEESTKIFMQKRREHSGVEANASQLEKHGLSVCRDKGIVGFKRYVAYGVLAYNLHRLGRVIRGMQQKKAAA